MTASAPKPLVSVVIATYNWSSALGCALRSVLLQTFTSYEVLVVGDACTDDSAEVVASFQDPRLRWFNLESNSGSQSVPNNYGIEHASGDYIAYLGHDDIWHPTHLESLLHTIETGNADLAGAVTILYGPPGSGVRAITGILEGDRFAKDDFMVPSSILHRRSLIDRIGLWRPPEDISLPPDIEFQRRALEAGARIVSTNQVSVFKFNAAWRKGAYIRRSVTEQETMLERVQSGEDFRQTELVDVLRSVLEHRFLGIKMPDPEAFAPGELVKRNARIKGTSKASPDFAVLETATRFDLAGQEVAFDWYDIEPRPGGTFRWSGPAPLSILEFPVVAREPVRIRLCVPHHFQEDLATDVEITVNGEPVPFCVEPDDDGAILDVLRACPARPVSLSLRVRRTVRPIDIGLNSDRRWLGIAVAWVELSPADVSAATR